MAARRGSYPGEVDTLLAAAAVVAAVVAWTAWEATMVSRLAKDSRSLPRRNAALAGASRLTVVGQLGLVAVALVVAGLAQVPVWSLTAQTSPLGLAATGLTLVLGGAALWWTARRGHRPQDRRALAAVAATAVATEVVLRGFGLGLLDTAGWSVTAAVLVTSVATGLLQAARVRPGSRAPGFVLATLLGFLLGLVALLTGSVVAAAAVHLAVAVMGLGRTFPARDHAPGCMCGHDHGGGTSTAAGTGTGSGTATGTAAGTAAEPGGSRGTSSAGTAAPGTAGDTSGGAPHAAHGPGAHTSCGTTCDHAGSSACAFCPLSTARV